MKFKNRNIFFLLLISLLLCNFAFPSRKKSYNDSDPVIISIKEKKLESFKNYLENYHIDAQNRNGKTFLMEASRRKRLDFVKYLIQKKANINKQDNQGNTALIYAIENGRDDTVSYLLDKNADIYLKKKKKKIFILACENILYEPLKKLVDKGMNFKEYDNLGRNALMVALYKNRHDRIIEYLINLGIDVNEKDDNGDTPLLMISRFADSASHMEILVKYGADVNIKDRKGKTALDYVKDKGFPDEIHILLSAGAKLSNELPEI
ncbi:MAG: ankyrin repeat domain-containing protein [Spirochaetes bacterium]|nr:ankyrin repeat domain-containing protein [Spirochaetota bacterium]